MISKILRKDKAIIFSDERCINTNSGRILYAPVLRFVRAHIVNQYGFIISTLCIFYLGLKITIPTTGQENPIHGVVER